MWLDRAAVQSNTQRAIILAPNLLLAGYERSLSIADSLELTITTQDYDGNSVGKQITYSGDDLERSLWQETVHIPERLYDIRCTLKLHFRNAHDGEKNSIYFGACVFAR